MRQRYSVRGFLPSTRPSAAAICVRKKCSSQLTCASPEMHEFTYRWHAGAPFQAWLKSAACSWFHGFCPSPGEAWGATEEPNPPKAGP